MRRKTSGKKQRVRILMAAGQEGFGRLASEVIREHLGRRYNLRLTFSKHADRILMLVQERVFDIFIVIADDISFSFEAPDPSPEERKKRVLRFVRHLEGRYGTPVLALHGWGDLDFGEKIAEADFSIRYPRIFEELRRAVQGFIGGTFDPGAAEIRNPAPDRRLEEKVCTAALIPEQEGFELLERLVAFQKEFETLPDAPVRCGPAFMVNPERYHPNRLFEVFDRLRLKDGCTLDFYFHRTAAFGFPSVYSRKTESPPVKSIIDFNRRFAHLRNRLRHVEFEPSPSGYFQFAVFSNAVSQFHLFPRQSCLLRQPVMTVRQLKRILASVAGGASREELEYARIVKPRLAVITTESFVNVMFVAYDPFRGLYFQHTYIRSNIIEHVSRIKFVDCIKRKDWFILSHTDAA